jgi:hypothetical protein
VERRAAGLRYRFGRVLSRRHTGGGHEQLKVRVRANTDVFGLLDARFRYDRMAAACCPFTMRIARSNRNEGGRAEQRRQRHLEAL